MLSIQTTDDGKTGAFKLLIDNEEVGIMEFHWETLTSSSSPTRK